MCIPAIIDASALGTVLDPREGAELRSWIQRGDGRVVYSNDGGYWNELKKSTRMFRLIEAYRRAGHARFVTADSIRAAEESLAHITTRSGTKDKPVLALAKVSDALVLCSDDSDLKDDFLDAGMLPKVGRRKRSVYPMDRPGADRRRFLARHRCRHGLCK